MTLLSFEINQSDRVNQITRSFITANDRIHSFIQKTDSGSQTFKYVFSAVKDYVKHL